MGGLQFPMYVSHGFVFLLSLYGMTSAQESCVQGENCHLPFCFCPTYSHPLGRENIPQIVYFGFDDAVQVTVSNYYDELFTKDKKNPNGCPISMTLYISNEYTDYNLVNKYYKDGNEMGVHSVTHENIDTAEKLLKEATEQKMNIEYRGNVPSSDVVGWRSPNLKTAGDDQPRILKELGYIYDNSLSYARDLNYPFPFTLDYGYPYPCAIGPCPGTYSKHEGFWEIMIHSLTDPKTSTPCGYVDGCRPESEDDALEYLWSNFLQTYENEKAPFGLNMHAAWFAYPGYLPAMKRFIDRLLTKDDVFIVNVEKMISWMKHPTPLSDIDNFEPWGCSTRYVKRSNNGYIPQHSLYQTNIQRTTKSQQFHPKISVTTKTTTTTMMTTPATSPKVQSIWNRYIPQGNINRGKPRPNTQGEMRCIQENNCHFPKCVCRSRSPPLGISLRDVPKIIYLAINTPIDGNTFRPLTRLLWPPRVNPNGSPVAGSIFIPISGNYPPYAKQLINMGARLGLRLEPNSNITAYNINQLRKELSAYYGIKVSKTGTESLGKIFQAFQRLNDTYDSFIVKEGGGFSWPNTLDFGISSTECSPFTGGCSSHRYPGLWEVGLPPMNNLPSSEIDTFRFLKFNFDRHYFTNKSPFGINIDQNWLLGPQGRDRVRGLNVFLDFIRKQPNVYVFSIDQMLSWIGLSTKYRQT